MGTDQEGKAEATEGKQYPSHPGGLGVGQDGRSVSASKKESGRTVPGDFEIATGSKNTLIHPIEIKLSLIRPAQPHTLSISALF
jgi:hypothetical protein